MGRVVPLTTLSTEVWHPTKGLFISSVRARVAANARIKSSTIEATTWGYILHSETRQYGYCTIMPTCYYTAYRVKKNTHTYTHKIQE